MLSIENQQLNSHWRQTFNNTTQDVCVFAPRRSGKSTALRKMFLDTPNSLMICLNAQHVRDTISWISANNVTQNNDNTYTSIISENTYGFLDGDIFRSMSYSTIFFDELAMFRTNITDVMFNCGMCCERMIAVTTPSGPDNSRMIGRYFRSVNFNYTFEEDSGLTLKKAEKETVEHFDREGDLFRI